jgi:uncharacterized protein (DUF488 family)
MENDPPDPKSARLFSVGHSNNSLDDFLRLLKTAGVTAIADVRSSPYSRRQPHFGRDPLRAALREADLAYSFLGDQLGGRPQDARLYDAEGRADYEAIRSTANFERGLDRLLLAQERFCVAMMCSEDDPLDCHRGLMITPALLERGVAPLHLRKDGSVESTAAMEERLLLLTGLAEELQPTLFDPSPAEERGQRVLAEAYRRMGRRKAFQAKGEEPGADSLPADW